MFPAKSAPSATDSNLGLRPSSPSPAVTARCPPTSLEPTRRVASPVSLHVGHLRCPVHALDQRSASLRCSSSGSPTYGFLPYARSTPQPHDGGYRRAGLAGGRHGTRRMADGIPGGCATTAIAAATAAVVARVRRSAGIPKHNRVTRLFGGLPRSFLRE